MWVHCVSLISWNGFEVTKRLINNQESQIKYVIKKHFAVCVSSIVGMHTNGCAVGNEINVNYLTMNSEQK